MWTDPILEEIHKMRAEHAAQFNYDLAAIVGDVKKEEQQSGKKFVSFPPRLIDVDFIAGSKRKRLQTKFSEQPLVLRDSGSND